MLKEAAISTINYLVFGKRSNPEIGISTCPDHGTLLHKGNDRFGIYSERGLRGMYKESLIVASGVSKLVIGAGLPAAASISFYRAAENIATLNSTLASEHTLRGYVTAFAAYTIVYGLHKLQTFLSDTPNIDDINWKNEINKLDN